MWGAEVARGDVALLRIPLSRFSRVLTAAPDSAFTKLPTPRGETMQNRFVGSFLLYGTGSSWGYATNARDGRVFAHRISGRGPTVPIPLGHGVDRIEPMGKDAIVVGGDENDLHFSPIALGSAASGPARGTPYVRRGAAQGELRSHGFFYRADGDAKGVLGLPVRGGGSAGYRHLVDGSASIAFVRNDGLALRDVGELGAHLSGGKGEDGCRASCVDWYGNARPIFRGRSRPRAPRLRDCRGELRARRPARGDPPRQLRAALRAARLVEPPIKAP